MVEIVEPGVSVDLEAKAAGIFVLRCYGLWRFGTMMVLVDGEEFTRIVFAYTTGIDILLVLLLLPIVLSVLVEPLARRYRGDVETSNDPPFNLHIFSCLLAYLLTPTLSIVLFLAGLFFMFVAVGAIYRMSMWRVFVFSIIPVLFVVAIVILCRYGDSYCLCYFGGC